MKYTFQAAVVLILAACQTQEMPAEYPPSPTDTAGVISTAVMKAPSTTTPSVGLTYQSPDGNRFVSGTGDIPHISPIDIPIEGVPIWIVAVPTEDGSLWAAVLEDGRVQAFHVADGAYSPIELSPHILPAGMPPILVSRSDSFTIDQGSSNSSSPSTHSVPLPGQNAYAYIDLGGNLILSSKTEDFTLSVDALPDARILQDRGGRLLLLSSPTTRYDHAIAGDGYEAASISLIDSLPFPRLVRQIDIPNGKVVEGIAPIWADLNQDGEREIIVTVSDAFEGAQIVVFNEQGEIIASGDPIGQGYRWRHQIAVAPFGPQGEIELVDVLTPHIGGKVEFFRLEGSRLVQVANLSGYSSHVIGSRNLDMAAAGDFDGDGIVELLIPSQNMRRLAAIKRVSDGAQVVWEAELGAVLSANISLIALPDDHLALGIGLDSGLLRIWHP